MLSQNDFLNLFNQNSKKESLSEFLRKYKVKTSIDSINLKKYIEKKNINIKDIEKLKDIIDNKNDYLIRFYNTSLRLPENLRITEEPMKNKKYNNNIF